MVTLRGGLDSALSINITQLFRQYLGIDLPDELPDDLKIETLRCRFGLPLHKNDKMSFAFFGAVKANNNRLNIGNGTQLIEFTRLHFYLSDNCAFFSVYGHDLPTIKGLDININAYKLTFFYKANDQNKRSGTSGEKELWGLRGWVKADLFGQAIKLSASYADVKDSGTSGEKRKIEIAYLDTSQGRDTLSLNFPEVNKGKNTKHNISTCSFSSLAFGYLYEKNKENRKSVFYLNGTGKLDVKNLLKPEENLFSMSGTIKLEYETDKDQDENSGLKLLFTPKSENDDNCFYSFRLLDGLLPKDVKDLFEIRLSTFFFTKNSNAWDIGGGLKFIMKNDPEQDNPVYRMFNSVFPVQKTEAGDQTADRDHVLEGILEYDSGEGLNLTFFNNSALIIPNFFNTILGKQDDSDTSNKHENKTTRAIIDWVRDNLKFDPEEVLDFGTSMILLEKITFNINKELNIDSTVAFGLPSKLNDRLFGDSRFNGLIVTCKESDFACSGDFETKTSDKQDQAKKGDENESDHFQRATIKIGSDKISGRVDKFNLINYEHLSKIMPKGYDDISKAISEKENKLLFNLDALVKDTDKSESDTDDEKTKYGTFSLNKPELALDTTTGSFVCSLGFEITSDHFRLPVRPLFDKFLINLLPEKSTHRKLNEFRSDLQAISEQLTDSIEIKNIDFITKDPKTGKRGIDLNGLIDFFRQFIPLAKLQQGDVILARFNKTLKDNSEVFINNLPERLTDYMSIKMPRGIDFKIEITADKSISFRFEVPQSQTTDVKSSDFSEYIQILMPAAGPTALMPFEWIGIRLSKIGFGSAVFNQAFRLDLSMTVDTFNIPEILLGIAEAELLEKYDGLKADKTIGKYLPSKDTMQFILPDPKKMCHTFETENLILLIFIIKIPAPPIPIPIPVPTFYDKLYINYNGLLGETLKFLANFPIPKISFLPLFTTFLSLIEFCSNEDEVMPVPSYGNWNSPDVKKKGIFPPINIGPVYFQLPGIIGYEKDSNGPRRRITIGTAIQHNLYFIDIVNMLANTVKFFLLSVVNKEWKRIPVDSACDSNHGKGPELPLNYFVQYTPQEMRIGVKKVMLFGLAELDFAWAIAAPGELSENEIRSKLASLISSDKNSQPDSALLDPSGVKDDDQRILFYNYFNGSLIDCINIRAFNLSRFILSGKIEDNSEPFSLKSKSNIIVTFFDQVLFSAVSDLEFTNDGLIVRGKVNIPKFLPVHVKESATLKISNKGEFAIELDYDTGMNFGGLAFCKQTENTDDIHVNGGLLLIISKSGFFLKVDSQAKLFGVEVDVEGCLDIHKDTYSGDLSITAESKDIKIFGYSFDLKEETKLSINNLTSSLEIFSNINLPFNNTVSAYGKVTIDAGRLFDESVSMDLELYGDRKGQPVSLKLGTGSLTAVLTGMCSLHLSNAVSNIKVRTASISTTLFGTLSIADTELNLSADIEFNPHSSLTIGVPNVLEVIMDAGLNITLKQGVLKIQPTSKPKIKIAGCSPTDFTQFVADSTPFTQQVSLPGLNLGCCKVSSSIYEFRIEDKTSISLKLVKASRTELLGSSVSFKEGLFKTSQRKEENRISGILEGKLGLPGLPPLASAKYYLKLSSGAMKITSDTSIFNGIIRLHGDIDTKGYFEFSGNQNSLGYDLLLVQIRFSINVTLTNKPNRQPFTGHVTGKYRTLSATKTIIKTIKKPWRIFKKKKKVRDWTGWNTLHEAHLDDKGNLSFKVPPLKTVKVPISNIKIL
ncbi:MAG: hypothetical protein PVG39_22225 [Desulfobacteraceae bacterium]